MSQLVIWISGFIFAGATGLTAFKLRNIPFDRYDLGPWSTTEPFRGSGLSTDVRTIAFRIEGAEAGAESWNGLLSRLDDIHRQLSPFGENARRPPFEYRTWYGRTAVHADAPRVFDRRYLENYIAILEKLAGVHPDEQ